MVRRARRAGLAHAGVAPRATRGSNDAASAPIAFSFEPEDDPVVCRMVDAAQEQARARVAAAREAEARAAAEAEARRREESTPAALAQRRAADLERRLDAKRKYAELASVVERLAVRAETHGSARDALSAAADAAAEEAREAERRRKNAMISSSGSGGRRPAGARTASWRRRSRSRRRRLTWRRSRRLKRERNWKFCTSRASPR